MHSRRLVTLIAGGRVFTLMLLVAPGHPVATVKLVSARARDIAGKGVTQP